MPSPTHPPTDTGAIGAERSVLEGLLTRVEAASGEDRALDGHIHGALGFQIIQRWGGFEWRPEGRGVWRTMPSPTASLDAALALCERVLGDRWHIDIDQVSDETFRASLHHFSNSAGYDQTEIGDNCTRALALLSAMLRALIAQAPSPATTPTGVLETSLIVEGEKS